MKRMTAMLICVAVIGLVLATRIGAEPPKPLKPLYGTVASVDVAAGKIVIQAGGENGLQVTVDTDFSTQVIISDKPDSLANLKAGMMVRVVPAGGVATEVRAFSPKPMASQPQSQPASGPKPLYGTIVSVSVATSRVVLALPGDKGQQVTVATNPLTKVLINDRPGTLVSLKVGMMVRVVPPIGTAMEIRAFPPKTTTTAPHSTTTSRPGK